MTEQDNITIYNAPIYAKNYKYIVAREDEATGFYWFYGAYDSPKEACSAANLDRAEIFLTSLVSLTTSDYPEELEK